MLKFETSKGKLENIEISGDAPELLADVCTIVNGIVDKLIETMDKHNTVDYMAGLDHILSDDGWKLIFDDMLRPSELLGKLSEGNLDES